MYAKLLAVVVAAISFIFLLGLFLPVSGCTQQFPTLIPSSQQGGTAIAAQLGTPIQLKIKQEAFLAAENLTLKFLTVAEDSRCPTDVTCLQEGQATIVLQIAGPGQNLEQQIQLTKKAAQEQLARATVGSYSLQLLAVEPYPKTPEAIAPTAYSITLLVSKAVGGSP